MKKKHEPKKPISLNVPWGRLSARKRAEYTAMGMTEQVWENNRAEPMPEVHLDDWQWLRVRRANWSRSRHKVMLGDRARSRVPMPAFEPDPIPVSTPTLVPI